MSNTTSIYYENESVISARVDFDFFILRAKMSNITKYLRIFFLSMIKLFNLYICYVYSEFQTLLCEDPNTKQFDAEFKAENCET